jgi:lysophospholipase L1-like esterase
MRLGLGLGLGLSLSKGGGVPSWIFAGSAIDLDFVNNRAALNGLAAGTAASQITFVRASPATDLLPSSPGTTYNTYASGVPRINGNGILSELGATNRLLNSTAPAMQTTASLATGSYTLWVNGTGSAVISAGSATMTGAGTSTNGTPVTINITGAGTVAVTVSGSLNAFQLESGLGGTSLIVTGGTIATRATESIKATVAGASLQVGTAFVSVVWPPANSGANATFVEGMASTGGLSFDAASNSRANLIQWNGASGRGNNNSSAVDLVSGSIVNFGMSWDSTVAPIGYVNGLSQNMGAASTPPELDWSNTLSIGSRGAGGSLWANTYIQRITLWYNNKKSATFLASTTATAPISSSTVFAWGDSLTTGNQDGSGTTYPNVLAGLLGGGRLVYNEGYPGAISPAILSHVQALPQAFGNLNIFEMGRNDHNAPSNVKGSIAAAVAELTTNHYLVTSILPATTDPAGDLATIATLNSDLSTLYSSRFVDVLAALQAHGDGSANDNADIAAGWIPRSLRWNNSGTIDPLHLNAAGYTVMANAYYAKVQANGW